MKIPRFFAIKIQSWNQSINTLDIPAGGFLCFLNFFAVSFNFPSTIRGDFVDGEAVSVRLSTLRGDYVDSEAVSVRLSTLRGDFVDGEEVSAGMSTISGDIGGGEKILAMIGMLF